MRIAVVEPVGRGGLIHYAFQLCRALAEEGARQGVEVVLVTDRSYELGGLEAPFRVERPLRLWDAKPETGAPPGHARRVLRRAGRAARWYRERLRLLGHLRRLRPDVVQLGDLRFAAELPFLLALRAGGARLADICHNLEPLAPAGGPGGCFGAGGLRGALSRFAFRRIYRRFDAVFVHWEENRRRFLESYGPLPGIVRSIPHGNLLLFEELRDPGATAASLRRRLGLAPEEPVVLAFGTLARYKGLDLLVEAFARVLPRVPAARLVVAGFPLPGFDPEELRALAGRLGVAGAVRVVPGYLPSGEVAAWMELAAVAAFPHREVFQSGVLQVAASLGAPVVASRVGATAEVVRDGETGLLVPPGDAGALAAALELLLREPGGRALARRLGERAAAEARSRFGWCGVARTVLATYRELLGERPEAAG